ncbi:MAG: Fe-S-containing protein [Candidatus Acidiferrales bacterium]
MLSAFLISLREGLEAALVVGICLVYLRKINRRDLARPVWYGVAAALALSGVAAYLLEHFAWNQEGVEGVLMLVAAALLVSMILWMRQVARTLRGEIEGKVGALAGRGPAAALGLFLFVFAMVLREGIETVIFLGALSFNAEGLPLVLGTALGLVAAVVVGLFFFKGALPVPLARFFDATSLMLMVITAQLVLSGLHELSEAEMIPSGPAMMRILGPIVRNEIFFFVLLLATAAWVVGRELLQSRARNERRWMAAGAAAALVALVLLTAEHIYARGTNGLPDVLPVQASSDTVRIPLDWVDDGALHRFRFTHQRTSIRFFVVTRPTGELTARLEACTICGAHPYFRDGDEVVCQNCAAAIPLGFIDTPGGCNPIKVDARVEGEELVIPVASLVGGERFFGGLNGNGR